MSEPVKLTDREVRCRCGEVGVITGVEGAEQVPDTVWVTHLVGLRMATHIHRSQQMPAVMAQLNR